MNTLLRTTFERQLEQDFYNSKEEELQDLGLEMPTLAEFCIQFDPSSLDYEL